MSAQSTPPSGPTTQSPGALPPGTRLGEFELLRVLGVGGFGIVYLAFDHDLEREVAVKEYMPASLAGRTETLHVSLRSQSDADTFARPYRNPHANRDGHAAPHAHTRHRGLDPRSQKRSGQDMGCG